LFAVAHLFAVSDCALVLRPTDKLLLFRSAVSHKIRNE